MSPAFPQRTRAHFAPSPPPPRYDSVDALRGLAMVWMTVFHFCFDLSHFGYWPQNFRTDPFWIAQRTVIVSMFLFCAGLGQAIALHQGQGWQRFGRRWLQIAGCALLVTAGSFAMFPRSFIHFGVLHGMAVMLIVARCTAGWGRWLWPAGLLALVLPAMAQQMLAGPWALAAPWMDARALNWLGLVSRKPLPGKPATVSLAQIAKLPIVLPGPTRGRRRDLIDRMFAEAGLTPTVALEADSLGSELWAVRNDVGSSLLPVGDMSHFGSDAFARPVLIEPAVTMTCSIVHSGSLPLTGAAAAVQDFLVAFVKRRIGEAASERRFLHGKARPRLVPGWLHHGSANETPGWLVEALEGIGEASSASSDRGFRSSCPRVVRNLQCGSPPRSWHRSLSRAAALPARSGDRGGGR